MNNEKINEILGIKESYELPEKLMNILLSTEKNKIFDLFIEEEPDLNVDILNEYYQQEHGDRDKLKQDFTPNILADLVSKLAGEGKTVADICSGTGTLTINYWKNNKDKDVVYHLEEFSSRAVPVLLFNLAIRNMNADLYHMDVLTREVFAVYEVRSEERYSRIEKVDKEYKTEKQDVVIMNPPYSLKWGGNESRFQGYATPPKSKADYGFVLHGMEMLNANGILIAILPHGVLFRGASEGKIRQKLIEDNNLDSVIGLPNNLFLHTGIPVCLVMLRKNRTTDKTMFIDASQEFEKAGKVNILTESNINKILVAYKDKLEIKRYSEIKTLEDFKENDYNLNIPRYVDTYIEEAVEDLDVLLKEIVEIDKELYQTKKELYSMFKKLCYTDGSSIEEEKELVKQWAESETGQLMLDL